MGKYEPAKSDVEGRKRMREEKKTTRDAGSSGRLVLLLQLYRPSLVVIGCCCSKVYKSIDEVGSTTAAACAQPLLTARSERNYNPCSKAERERETRG